MVDKHSATSKACNEPTSLLHQPKIIEDSSICLTCSLSTAAAGEGRLTLDSTNPSSPFTINSLALPETSDITMLSQFSCLPGEGWRLHPLASTFSLAPAAVLSMKTGEESQVLVSR